MATSDLLNVPKTEVEWSFFSWNNRDAVTRIRQAIKAQKNVNLNDYQLDPINPNDPSFFLQNNQQAHTDFNGVLNLQSTDLLDVNLADPRELESWIFLNWKEVQQAELALGI